MTQTNENHATLNASAWLVSIKAMVSNLESANFGDEGYDNAREAITESPLSVEVRSSWFSPGTDLSTIKPDEFCILLSFGGPALRIMGDLDEQGPYSCEMQWQDFNSPWTLYEATQDEAGTMLTFCKQFYFGD